MIAHLLEFATQQRSSCAILLYSIKAKKMRIFLNKRLLFCRKSKSLCYLTIYSFYYIVSIYHILYLTSCLQTKFKKFTETNFKFLEIKIIQIFKKFKSLIILDINFLREYINKLKIL